METLSEQLTSLYEGKWKELVEQLKVNNIQVQSPFLISALRIADIEKRRAEGKYSDEVTPENEEWYTKADVKIMFFGQEPYMWEKNSDVGDLMYAYEKFLGDSYVLHENGGYFDQDKRSRIFKFAINGILSCLMEIMKETYPGKTVSMIWNNISKLSVITKSGGGPVNAFTHDIEHNYFHVIPDEVKILQPDILVFFTGPGENKYYKYIKENFTPATQSPLGNRPIHDVSKLDIDGVKLAYKTYHPRGTNLTDAEQWENYWAILNDIKANLKKLLGEE